MTDTPHPDRSYDDARAALREVLGDLSRCSPGERELLQGELARLTQLTEKLEQGRVDIAVFGEIDTGKSALINALVGRRAAEVSVRGGWTKEVWNVAWEAPGTIVPGLAGSQVVLIDTPGINEVDGQTRARMAHDAAQRADLILFVTDSDLNEVEHAALRELAAAGRPVLVVFNKTDLYSPVQRQEILDVLRRERLPGLVPAENVVSAAADPRPVEVVVEDAAGRTRSEERQPPPRVDELKVRILELLEREGKALLALNAALYAADTSDRIAAVKLRLRERQAREVIWRFVVFKALAVGFNPVPVADVLGGTALDAAMVVTLGRVYGLRLSMANAAGLIRSIVASAGAVTLAEYGTHLAATALKGLSLGLSTALTGSVQGAAAGFGSYIVGHAARYYLAHGASWGGRSPKQVVRAILASTDRQSVVSDLREEIARRLRRNPHVGKRGE